MIRACRRWPWLLVLLGSVALGGCSGCSGCGGETINSRFGRRDMESVNGTDAIYNMTQQAGHRTTSKYHFIAPTTLERVDTIFWMPDIYTFPAQEDRQLIDQWLREKSGRTLIYVGRDYDSAPLYWEHIKPIVPPDKTQEVISRLLDARTRHTEGRMEIPNEMELEWFDHTRLKSTIRFGSEGKPPVINGKWPRTAQQTNNSPFVDPAAVELSLGSQIDPPFEAEVLLACDGEILVTDHTVPSGENGDSRVIVVANASFLTNMALVNHEHRKLAQALIDELEPESHVLFLESDQAGLYRQDNDEDTGSTPSLQILTAPRLTHTFLHLAALAIIFGFSRWPIFGRARENESNHESDFGRHVEALGAMLERGERPDFALARVRHYQDLLQSANTRDPAAPQAPTSGNPNKSNPTAS